MNYFTLDEFVQAAGIVSRHMTPTPQFAWPLLSAEIGAEVWLKHENCTPTGAFKVRGGLVYVDRLVREATRGSRNRHSDSWQPRPEPGVRWSGSRHLGDDRRAWQHPTRNAAMQAFGAE